MGSLMGIGWWRTAAPRALGSNSAIRARRFPCSIQTASWGAFPNRESLAPRLFAAVALPGDDASNSIFAPHPSPRVEEKASLDLFETTTAHDAEKAEDWFTILKPFLPQIEQQDSEEEASGWMALWNMSSTLKKRRSKMNKHKLRKRRKKMRLKTKR